MACDNLLGLNWTNVGLKSEMALRIYLDMESLNWTNVGLKCELHRKLAERVGDRLNWTNVGLKSTTRDEIARIVTRLNWTNVGLKSGVAKMRITPSPPV